MTGWRAHWLLVLVAFGVGCISERPGSYHRGHSEAKAVTFLKQEVPAWWRENHCFSCHNNGDAARALYAASREGYRIEPTALADTTAWLRVPTNWVNNKGDPGFSDQRLANIQFAAALLGAREAGHLRDDRPLREAATKVAADQAFDGSWPIDAQNPAGSPATYGPTLATFMALQVLKGASGAETEEAQKKARAWLERILPNNTVAAATALFLGDPSSVDAALRFIEGAQNRDGGWGPYKDSPSEPFDTALVLVALSRTDHNRLIESGRKFLISQQNADGSWPATTRPPRGESYAQMMSTTGWATLALLATNKQR